MLRGFAAATNYIQGGFFNWDPPKNHKYWKKLKYPNWDPPKNHKYGKKLKYPNWDPPKISKCGKKNRTKRIMFVFRVQQTAMVCEHTTHHGAAIISGTVCLLVSTHGTWSMLQPQTLNMPYSTFPLSG